MLLTLNAVSRLSEEEARKTFEKIRWPDGVPVCPHCGSIDATKLAGEAHRSGLYKCKGCEQQFTATINTILEDSHIPIRTWLMAFAIICSSKKGVSALQLQRQLGLGSYRSAWHMAHRIRFAMNTEPLASLLKGVVEVDETYVGGKPRKKHGKPKSKRGRGTKKTPVLALVERGGKVRSKPIERVNAKTLKAAIKETVDSSSTIMTDEWKGYRDIGKDFKGGHKTVNHGAAEFVGADGVSTNEVESYFALLKRGIVGSFHHVSKQHLPRYCDEFSFRWNYRKTSDSVRTAEAIRASEGKRLYYKPPKESKSQ